MIRNQTRLKVKTWMRTLWFVFNCLTACKNDVTSQHLSLTVGLKKTRLRLLKYILTIEYQTRPVFASPLFSISYDSNIGWVTHLIPILVWTSVMTSLLRTSSKNSIFNWKNKQWYHCRGWQMKTISSVTYWPCKASYI